MVKYKKILVPLDGSKRSFAALDNAVYLAKSVGAEITAIHVLPRLIIAGTRTDRIEHQIEDEGKSILKEGKLLASRNEVKCDSELTKGEPGPTITKYAKNGKFDLIIMSSTGTGSAKDGFFGSISNYVMHASEVPILIIR